MQGKWQLQKYSTVTKHKFFFRQAVLIGLFVTYFSTCSCYTVIIAKNFHQVAADYIGYEPEIRIIIAMLLLPLILLAWVPNLKYLAPVSMIANVFMGLGLGITIYYLVIDLPSVDTVPFVGHVSTFAEFFAITMFAIEAIGVVSINCT